MRKLIIAAAAALGICLLGAGCNGDKPDSRASSTVSESAPAPETPPTGVPGAGLDFVEVGPLAERFRPQVAGADLVAVVTPNSKSVEFRSANGTKVLHTYVAPVTYSISDTFIDYPHIAIVIKKQDESADDQLIVLDVKTFNKRRLDPTAPRPATGSWAAGAGKVAYGSFRGEDYCLAVVDLDSLTGDLHECVPPRHGIHQVSISRYGLGYATFDDSRPSCGTARIERTGADPQTITPQKKCAPWEAVAVTNDAVMWSEVTKPTEIEVARFYARVGDGETQFVGEGTTGSLLWCGDAAWYVNQSTSQLMRWTPSDGPQLAYQVPDSPGTISLVGAPACSGGEVSFPAKLDIEDSQEAIIIRASVVN